MGFGSRKPKVKCSHRGSCSSGTGPEVKAPLRAVGSEIKVLLELGFWILWRHKSKIRGHNNLGSFGGSLGAQIIYLLGSEFWRL